MDKQREEFEEAFKNNNAYNIELIHGTNSPTFEKNSKGEYLKISVQNHWEMWQQAQKVAVPDDSKIDGKLLQRYINSIRHFNDIGDNCKFIEYDLVSLEDIITQGRNST